MKQPNWPLSTAQLAQYLEMKPRTLRHYIYVSKRLKGTLVNQRRLEFSKAQVKDFLANKPANARNWPEVEIE